MLDIPATLLSKINQSMQTIANNANPQMDIISQRAAKYINKGNFLAPQTVRTGNSLARLDVCARREDKNEEPTEYVMLYIEGGLAKVATLPYVFLPDELFEYQYTVGPATDVAICFDGIFEHISSHKGLYFDTAICWTLVTSGDPYIAIINDGILTIQQGQNGTPFGLCDANVTRVSLIRGYKSVTDVLTDQGLVCAYVKTDGKAYYRNYCEQEDGSYIWEIEREITELGTGITDLGLFRTGDYRLGFLVEKSGIITWTITDRSWSGMAWLPEYLSANVSMTVDVYEVDYHDTQSDDDHISAAANMTVTVLWGISPIFTAAENIANGEDDYGYLVRLTFDHDIDSVAGNDLAFMMEDEAESLFASTAVTQISDRVIEVAFQNFNNAIGEVTVTYTAGTMVGEAGQAVDTQSFSFTPTNLVPFAVDPPVVISIENIIDWSVT